MERVEEVLGGSSKRGCCWAAARVAERVVPDFFDPAGRDSSV